MGECCKPVEDGYFDRSALPEDRGSWRFDPLVGFFARCVLKVEAPDQDQMGVARILNGKRARDLVIFSTRKPPEPMPSFFSHAEASQ